MKLRNKKTGEIITAIVQVIVESNHPTKPLKYDTQLSLAKLNEEWEDAPEEPKGYWYIDCAAPYPVDFCEFNEDTEDDKEIGNYFETKEAAEEAVKKLKALKRLRDKGFKFIELRAPNYNAGTDIITIKAKCDWNSKNIDDLDLLFVEEEDV